MFPVPLTFTVADSLIGMIDCTTSVVLARVRFASIGQFTEVSVEFLQAVTLEAPGRFTVLRNNLLARSSSFKALSGTVAAIREKFLHLFLTQFTEPSTGASTRNLVVHIIA